MPAMNYNQVAHYYDAYVQSEFDLQFFQEETQQITGKVLELMCGTGRVSIPLLESGVDLTCVDSSPAMLERFREKLQDKGLSALLIEKDVTELSLEQEFDLIFIPFHSFGEITAVSQQRRVLDRIRVHLSRYGRFICTLHNPPFRLKTVDGLTRLAGKFPLPKNDSSLLLWRLETFDAATKIVSGYQFYEEYGPDGQLRAKSYLDINFYLHDRDSFETLVQAAGFRVEALYGSYARETYQTPTSPVMIWILGL